MKISNPATNFRAPSLRPKSSEQPVSQIPEPLPTDYLQVAKWALAGSVPLVGAGANFFEGTMAAVASKNELTVPAMVGVGANILGSAGLLTGLLAGSPITSCVGVGLLAVSGAVSGWTVSKF